MCLSSLHHSNHSLLLPGHVRVEANTPCVFVIVPKIRWSLFYLSKNLHRSKQNIRRTTRIFLPGFPHHFRHPLREGQGLLTRLGSSLLRVGSFPDRSLPLPLQPGACCLQIAVDIVYLVSDLSEEGKQNKMSSNDIRLSLRKKNPFCLWRWSVGMQDLRVDIVLVHSKQHRPLHVYLASREAARLGLRLQGQDKPGWPLISPLSFQSRTEDLQGGTSCVRTCARPCFANCCGSPWKRLQSCLRVIFPSYRSYLSWNAWVWIMS